MFNLRFYKHFLILFIYLMTYPCVSYSQQAAATDTIYDAVNSVIQAEEHPYFAKSTFLAYKNIIDQLYFASPDALLWLNEENAQTDRVTAVLHLISYAKNSGLNEEHYHLSLMRTKWFELKGLQNVDVKTLAYLDTAISINLLHYLSDLQFGRIDPKTLKFHFELQKDTLHLIPLILEAIDTGQILHLANLVEPKLPAYRQLKKALFDYRKINDGQNFNTLNYVSTIRPEETKPQVISIRQKLNSLGVSTNKNNSASCLYDKELVDNIKDFQFRHGLTADGVIGKRTIAALKPTLSQRIQQIEFALERLRWLPKIQPGPLVLVNIPAFQLWAYESDELIESEALNMKVIVGKSKDKLLKSPVFTANMYYLEFSPYWNIPRSITIKEIIPKLEKDPFYIEQQNMELVTGFHNNEGPVPYVDNVIEQLKNSTLKLRQRPGGGNALGKVKFIFPNNYNVYLHDTPSRRLFNKPKRDLSHGCIRVEKPTELAQFLLKTKPGWNQKKIWQSMNLNQPRQVRLSSSVPVIIFYSTAFPVDNKINFYEDIYDYDIKLSKALLEHNKTQIKQLAVPIQLPVSNTAGIDMNKI